ncbi:hypothetical protein BH20ACI3_BH20ACI3_04400 [soil metagenome]
MLNRYSPFPFLALEITLIAIGATGQRTFNLRGHRLFCPALAMMRKRRNHH